MNASGTPPEDRRARQKTFNLVLAGVVSQVGLVTVVIILVALFGGLWLDSQFGTRPIITVTLMVLSMPVTLGLMLFIVRRATAQLKPVTDINKNTEESQSSQEDVDRGTND
ncbi:MAG: AtpZ/AtpI family protein [Anaerolineales bacterium]|nr:AtpZ/AtpI family protein [Anaerolineales bacterium]